MKLLYFFSSGNAANVLMLKPEAWISAKFAVTANTVEKENKQLYYLN